MSPSFEREQFWWAQGMRRVVGIDEAGRGCWAGPVVAAAVVLPPALGRKPALLGELNDSKQLSVAQRETLYAQILLLAEGIGVGVVPAFLIDAYGILPATRLAMTVALLSLPCAAEVLLIDALRLDGLAQPQEAIIRGDGLSYSIAAASVVAKVTRDRLLHQTDAAYPGYGFAQHKGYGTAQHQAALAALGVCAIHRRTFMPVAEAIERRAAQTSID